jgi:hypothetical protein
VGFRVEVQVFVDQMRESFFCAQRRSLCVTLARTPPLESAIDGKPK